VSDGAASVPGGGDKHREQTRFAAHKIAHKPRHEARAKILERQRWPVKEFKNVERRRKRNEFDWKIDGFGDDLPQDFFRNIRSGERTNHTEADFGEGQASKFFQLFGGVARDFGGHVKPAIGCQTAQNRASQ